MSTMFHVHIDDRVRDVQVTETMLQVGLCDNRTIMVPLAWYPRLIDATPQQRARWHIDADGDAIRWPDVDEWVYVGELLGDGHAQHEINRQIEASYRAMASDEEGEAEALEWIEAVIGDVCDEDDADVDYEARVLELAESIIRKYQ